MPRLKTILVKLSRAQKIAIEAVANLEAYGRLEPAAVLGVKDGLEEIRLLTNDALASISAVGRIRAALRGFARARRLRLLLRLNMRRREQREFQRYLERLEAARHQRIRGGLETACCQCGCSDSRACPGGCGWVEPGLCSSCERKRR